MNKGKLKPENGASDSKLSAEQTSLLIKHLSDNLFHHTHEIIAFVLHTWGIFFSVAGMNKWLHRNAFSYKNRLERLINSASYPQGYLYHQRNRIPERCDQACDKDTESIFDR